MLILFLFRVSVRLGEHNLDNKEDCYIFDSERICADPVQDIDVEKIIRHAQFNGRQYNINDIALIRLVSAFIRKGKNQMKLNLNNDESYSELIR